jgi:hypothetical protein
MDERTGSGCESEFEERKMTGDEQKLVFKGLDDDVSGGNSDDDWGDS